MRAQPKDCTVRFIQSFIFILMIVLHFNENGHAQTTAKDLIIKGDQMYADLKYQNAIKEYNKSFEKKESTAALLGLAKSHFELGTQLKFNGESTQSNHHYLTALQYAERLVEIDLTLAEGRLLRGLIKLYLGESTQAKNDFVYVNTNYPDNGRAYYYLWTLEPAQGMAKIEHPYVQKALTLDPGLYELHQELGAYYASLNMADEAIAAYGKSIALRPKNYKANFSIGQVYWALGDLEKMRHHFNEALIYFPKFGYAEMLLAGVELMSGNFPASIPLIRAALKHNPATEQYLSMYIQNYPDLANYNFKEKQNVATGPLDAQGYPAHYQDAVQLSQSFDHFGAIDLFHQCYSAYENYTGAQPQWKVSILAWLTHNYREVGDYALAIQYGKQALKMAMANDLNVDQASLAANLALIYDSWGDHAQSIRYQKSSVDMLLKFDQTDKLYDAYTNLGGYHRKWENYDSAIYYHQLAMQQITDETPLKIALIKKELALSYSANQNHEAAKKLVEEIQVLRKSITDNSQDAALDFGIARVYYGSGDYTLAKKFIELAAPHYLELQKAVPAHPLIFPFVETYIGISTMSNDIPLAYNNYLAMNDILFVLTNQFFPSMNENGKLTYYRKVKDRYESFNSFVINQTNKPKLVYEKMFENQLLIKGLLFNNAQKMHHYVSQSTNPELKKHYAALIKRKNLIARSITRSAEENKVKGLNTAAIQQEIDSLEIILAQSGVDSGVEDLYQKGLIEKIKSQLGPKEAAIEMIRYRDYDFSNGGKFTQKVNYLALILRGDRDEIDHVILDHGHHLESKAYKAYVRSITFDLEDLKSYDQFWAPIQAKLNGVEKVYFAGDGVFHKINLNTLYNPKTDQYVIDELDIRLVTSTRDILKETTDLPKRGNIFLIGSPSFELNNESTMSAKATQPGDLMGSRAFANIADLEPLPGTFSEIKSIETIFSQSKWEAEVLIGDEALEEHIKNLESPTVLHIATHGYFEESKPKENPLLYSGLLLAGASSNYTQRITEGEDGILTAYEAMHLDLSNTQMVVLSACETGMGRVENGDGVYGLQRAFLIAGTQSVIMSMWKVNDQTTMELMQSFYEKLTVAKDMHLAFRAAQLDLKEKHPNPKYWGAFNIAGK